LRGDYNSKIEIGEGSNIQDLTMIHCGADGEIDKFPTIIGKNVTVG
jgi:carbonic anhydrase/acetyltransferase-like protein (isoleucine patch superfamily)